VFESNGPDVKVRGNAQHVAEKYLQLARDAQSSGDSVMAENYYQHAEHYLRIVAAAQSFAQQNGPPGGIRRPFGSEDIEDDEADGPEEDEMVPAGHGPQPDIVDLQGQRPPREMQNRDDEGETPRDFRRPQAREGDSDRDQPREFRRPREREFRDRDNRDGRPPREGREFRDNREGRELRDSGPAEEAQGNGWSGHQPDFLRRSSGNSAPGNGRFRRDNRRQGERKEEAGTEAQPSDSEPSNESSEDFASN
jgi:hypothetical protein